MIPKEPMTLQECGPAFLKTMDNLFWSKRLTDEEYEVLDRAYVLLENAAFQEREAQSKLP